MIMSFFYNCQSREHLCQDAKVKIQDLTNLENLNLSLAQDLASLNPSLSKIENHPY